MKKNYRQLDGNKLVKMIRIYKQTQIMLNGVTGQNL